MLFHLSYQVANPVYPQFRAQISYTMPWMNVTQVADVAYDAQSQRIKYAYENYSQQICDYNLGFADTYYYGFTAKDKYHCYTVEQQFNETFIAFVPDLENYTYMGQNPINGVNCNHYRLIQYNYTQQPNQYDYEPVDTYQYDFFCIMNMTTGQCLPVLYRMNVYNWFYNNPDIYLIEYRSFEFFVEDKDFEFDFYNTSCPNASDFQTTTQKLAQRPRNFLDHIKTQHQHQVLQQNMKTIHTINTNPNLTFKARQNRFARFEYGKIHSSLSGRIPNKLIKSNVQSVFTVLNTPLVEDLPSFFDWRTRGVLSTVKDQLFCGSCWTFSSTGVVEMSINIARQKTNQSGQPLIRLSEQKVVDCFWDKLMQYQGCDGGNENGVLQELVGRTQFTSEHNYPYLGEDDWCKNNTDDVFGYNITAFHLVPPYDIVQLKRAIFRGPVAIAMATPESMLYYAGSGVYNDPTCGSAISDLDHAVIAIGWGESEYGPYWIIRNSWSPAWGQDGYFYVAMKDNICGILDEPSWIEVESIN